MNASVFLLTFALTIALVVVLRKRAAQWGLLDVPDLRKTHLRPTPLVGGLAMGLASTAVAMAFSLHRHVPASVLALGAGMLAVGVIDDRRSMRVRTRVVLEVLLIVGVVRHTGFQLTQVGELLGPYTLQLGRWGLPLTVVGMLGVINAVNLSDGEDGLAGGLAFTSLCTFLAALWHMEQAGSWPASSPNPMPWVTGLIGAVLGFLVFNLRTHWRKQASVFMGDGGSLFLGACLAWLAVYVAGQPGDDAFPAVGALWALIVPLYDTVACMLRRVLSGRSPMHPDRMHLHHLLQAWGLSKSVAVLLLILFNALGGALALHAWRSGIPDHLMFYVFLAGFCLYFLVSGAWWWSRRAVASSWCNEEPGRAAQGSDQRL